MIKETLTVSDPIGINVVAIVPIWLFTRSFIVTPIIIKNSIANVSLKRMFQGSAESVRS